jgi:hypothetical protein
MTKARLKAVLGVFASLVIAVSAHLTAQSLFFSDNLAGPASPELSIPNEYSYTAAGLQRTVNTGGETDRPVVKTLSDAYLTATQFTAELTMVLPGKDIAYFGLGQGTTDGSYYNEPGDALMFRVHNWDGYLGIQVSARKIAGDPFAANHEMLVPYTPGLPMTFRITRDGDSVTFSVPSADESWTYSLSQFAVMGLTNTNTHLFFGNTFTGSVFSNFSVVPGGNSTTPPAISSVAPSTSSIWPPNGKMVPVTVQVSATGSPEPTCAISSVSSSEGSATPGGPQSVITGPLSVNLRAERLGSGPGRTYTVVTTCTNSAGSASASAIVTVPHDQRK